MNFYKTNESKIHEEFSKRGSTLINESIYYLNKSKSKYVSVGFGLDRKYKPVIKLEGVKNQNIILNEDQWISFLNNEGIIMNFLFSNSFGWLPMQGKGFEIHFIFINDVRVIKLVQEGGHEVYLAEDSLNNLFKGTPLIKYRLDLLKNQDFANYYNILVSGISTKNGDLIQNVYDIILPLTNINSLNVCCVLELLNFYSDCIIEDVEAFACDAFVKSCIGK